jgi:hypothetical protein
MIVEVFLLSSGGGDHSKIQKCNLFEVLQHQATFLAADQMPIQLSSFRGRELADSMKGAKRLHPVVFGLVSMSQSVLQDRCLRLQYTIFFLSHIGLKRPADAGRQKRFP